MSPYKAIATTITACLLVCLATACSENPAPKPEDVALKATLLCDGDEGVTPFTLRCEYFYLDDGNNQVDPEDAVNWTLDIALEGIAQRFYSQSAGNSFFTEIDRPGEYTLIATNNGNKTNLLVTILDPAGSSTTINRQVPVRISSDEVETHERQLDASPGYEIIQANIQVHKNNARVSSRVTVNNDKTSAKLVVELQPKEDTFKTVRAWFAGNVILTERKIVN